MKKVRRFVLYSVFNVALLVVATLVGPANSLAPSVVEAQVTCEPSIADAPCAPANVRMVTVDASLSASNPSALQFKTIQAAADASRPGDTIQIKNGTYSDKTSSGYGLQICTSGTSNAPITYMAYPSHTPLIDTEVEVHASWLIFQGLKIQNTQGLHDGIGLKVVPWKCDQNTGQQNGHITIRKNYFTNNPDYGGIQLSSGTHVLAEQNTFAFNGTNNGSIACGRFAISGESIGGPSHCHGIYVAHYIADPRLYYNNPTLCRSPRLGDYPETSYLHFRRNVFAGNSGSGIQYNTAVECSEVNHDHLIENNLFINNMAMLYLQSGNATNVIVRNNTSVKTVLAPYQTQSNSTGPEVLAQGVKFINNIFYQSAPSDQSAILWLEYFQTRQPNIWRYNALFTRNGIGETNSWAGGKWLYGGLEPDGAYRFISADKGGPLATTYKAITGDANAIVDISLTSMTDNKAGFVSLPASLSLVYPNSATDGDFRLQSTSVLRDAGDNANCPATDFDSNRRMDGKCDIGAFEFGATSGEGTNPTPTPTPTPSPTTSATLTPTPSGNAPTVTLSASPTTAAPGSNITVTWNVTAGIPGVTDWVTLVPASEPNANYVQGKYTYINSRTSGSHTTTAPATPGTYEFRYFLNDGLTSVAKSNSIIVTSGGTSNQCTLYTTSTPIPAGFASPFNVIKNPNQNMMNASCSATGQAITLGNGSPQTYIYKTGYVLRNNTWQQVNYIGSNLLYSNWYVGNANGLLNLATAELTQGAYFLSYQCQWIQGSPSSSSGQTGVWKCGCKTAACAGADGNKWQIQFIKH